MADQNSVEDVLRCIKKWASDQGIEIEPTTFFEGIDELYKKPSSRQVVDEELPRIINADPGFFERYGINLPGNQEVHLFNLYYETQGRRGLKRVHYSAKVCFRHIRFSLIDYPDQNRLNNAIEKYKIILEGNYFNEQA